MTEELTNRELNSNLSKACTEYLELLMISASFCKTIACNEDDEGVLNSNLDYEGDVESLSNIIVDNYEDIADESSKRVLAYVTEYDVATLGIDYHKCAYFFSYTIPIWLSDNKETLNEIKESHSIIVGPIIIYLMQHVLQKDIQKDLDTNMLRKMLISSILPSKSMGKECEPINNDYPWFNTFGCYGIYMIFKNVYKCCKACDLREAESA